MAMAHSVLFVALLLALHQGCLAQYGAGLVKPGNSVDQRGRLSSSQERYYVTAVSLGDLKGVWRMEGMEAPQSETIAVEDSAVPDCSNEKALPNYIGLDYDAPRFLVLAGATNATNQMNVNQQRSTFSPNVTYSYPFIVSKNAQTGANSCTHFQSYVDMSTGELMAETISISVWTKNTTEGAKGPIRTRPTCNLTGRELVGCYTGQVALGDSIPMAPSSAPSVSISSIAPAASSSGAVTTISRNTYKCRQGECLRLSPKHSSSSPVYGG